MVVGLMLCAVSATADPVDPAPDGIGIYFDSGGESNCSLAAPFTTVTAYLLALNLTTPSGIIGWECSISTSPANLSGITYTLAGHAFNIFAPPKFSVGLAAALPCVPAITLMTMRTFYMGGPVQFAIGPCVPCAFGPNSYFPQLPPGPGYALGNNPGMLKRLYPSTADLVPGTSDTYWVAGINADCPVANVQDSWGGVKALYQ